MVASASSEREVAGQGWLGHPKYLLRAYIHSALKGNSAILPEEHQAYRITTMFVSHEGRARQCTFSSRLCRRVCVGL